MNIGKGICVPYGGSLSLRFAADHFLLDVDFRTFVHFWTNHPNWTQALSVSDIPKITRTLIRRKERWTLTPLAWAILLLGIVMLLLWGSSMIHPFLACTDPINAEVLAVEGWLPDYALEDAIQEFRSHPYRCVITIGGPIEVGGALSDYKTYATLAARTLARLGLDSNKIIAVPAPRLRADRTFASAVALNRWLRISGANVHSVNLFSLGIHTRRSWLLFRKALDKSIALGSIAARDQSYDSDQWWRYSAGVEAVVFESVGYIYVRFFFPIGAEHALSAW